MDGLFVGVNSLQLQTKYGVSALVTRGFYELFARYSASTRQVRGVAVLQARVRQCVADLIIRWGRRCDIGCGCVGAAVIAARKIDPYADCGDFTARGRNVLDSRTRRR